VAQRKVIVIALVVLAAMPGGCGPSYSDPSKCNVADPDSNRLAACMANRPPWYCGGDSGVAGGTSLHGGPHAFRYDNQSDHVCSKGELDAAGFAPEVRPASQR